MCPTDLTPQFLARTPAKAILAGEHFVLHGAPAVAVPVPDLVLTMRVSLRTGSCLRLPEPFEQLSDEISAVLDHKLHGHVRIWVTSEIPIGAGLGSSAAFSVALGRCLVLADRRHGTSAPASDGQLENRADELRARTIANLLEASLHGRASGIDTAVVARNSPICLQRREPDGTVEIERLAIAKPLCFALLDSGIRRKTSEQIVKIGALQLHDRVEFQGRVEQGVVATLDTLRGLKTGDLALLQDSIKRLGALLQAMGLEPASMSQLRESAEQNAVSLKITGAGGGGYLLAYHPDKTALQDWLTGLGASYRGRLFDVPSTETTSDDRGLQDKAMVHP